MSERPEAFEGQIPDHYVALSLIGDGECCRPGELYAPLTEVIVRATATGAAVAMIAPPPPYGTFVGVSAAADGRTFVVAAQESALLPLSVVPATGFFLLRIDPDHPSPDGRAHLTPLPVTGQEPGTLVSGLALSPDASRLAVTAGSLLAPFLHVFTLATGAERVWDSSLVGLGLGPGADQGSLSWTADGRTLALICEGVRLLDTAASGARLLDCCRLVLPVPRRRRPGPYWRQVMISPDGQTIVAVIQGSTDDFPGRGRSITQRLVTFSAVTGEQLNTLSYLPVDHGYQRILWSSPSADLLIVSGTEPGPTVGPFNLGASAGLLTAARFTPIPWSNRTFAAAW